MTDNNGSTGGVFSGMARAVATMLGLHLQYAQREVRNDIGRLVTAAVLLVVGGLLLFVALLVGHAALVLYVSKALPSLGLLRAVLLVAGGDVVLALLVLLVGRSKLKQPLLKQTRTLVRDTVTSLAELK